MNVLMFLLSIFLRAGSCATRNHPENFSERLKRCQAQLPFKDWAIKQDSGLEQYTAKNCAAVQRIFTQLIDHRVKCGEDASESIRFTVFDEAMAKLNTLNERIPELFESEERDQLCAELESIAASVGIDADKDSDGESRITVGREW